MLNYRKYLPVLILLIMKACPARAQELLPADTIADSSIVLFGVNLQHLPFPVYTDSIDTALFMIHQYNPAKKHGQFFATMGNIGLADISMNQPILPPTGFQVEMPSFSNNIFEANSVPFFRSKGPYTQLNYVMGRRKEQRLQGIYSQNLIPRLTLGLNFRFSNAPGSYTNQKTDFANLFLSLTYQTKSGKYGFISHFLRNRMNMSENGGIINDSLFVNNSEPDRSIIPVNLEEAKNSRKDNLALFKHYFTPFGPSLVTRDDSLNQGKESKFMAGTFFHEISFSWRSQSFYDPNPVSAFYPAILKDSSMTNDSISLANFSNTLGWTNINPAKNALPDNQISAGMTLENIRAWQSDREESFIQTLGFIRFLSASIPNSTFLIDGKYYFSGYNIHDHDLNASYDYRFQKSELVIGIAGASAAIGAPWLSQHLTSNHFSWDNNFAKIKKEMVEAFADLYGYRLKGSYYNIRNYIYFDTEARPAQLADPAWVFSLSLNKKLSKGHFTLLNSIHYQATSHERVIKMPDLMLRESLVFHFSMFKKALFSNAGLDIFYCTGYNGYAYMPVTRQFYTQDEIKTGNSLFVDVFFDIQIKRARLFIKYDHANAGLAGYDYFLVPHYPEQDGAFKFGVSWRFFD